MDTMDSGDEYEYEYMSMDMLEDIRDGSQSHSSINSREECYIILDHIKKDNRNGKDCYYLRKKWVQVYTKCLRL